jgi:hypothetical protein
MLAVNVRVEGKTRDVKKFTGVITGCEQGAKRRKWVVRWDSGTAGSFLANSLMREGGSLPNNQEPQNNQVNVQPPPVLEYSESGSEDMVSEDNSKDGDPVENFDVQAGVAVIF